MKKLLLSVLIGLLPLSASATKLSLNPSLHINRVDIPAQFATSSETEIMEWGCPVSEVVKANSGAEALEKIGKECVEVAKQAANEKPGVFEVIEASVIWPDVVISKDEGGFRLSGTFFLETLVLRGAR